MGSTKPDQHADPTGDPDADPVAQARDALAAAQAAKQDAKARLVDLQKRIISGDLTVSADAHADAEHTVRHAELLAAGAEQALDDAQRDARLNELQHLKTEIITETGTPDEVLADYLQIVEASGRIISRCHARQRNITGWTRQLHRAGVPQSGLNTPPDPAHAGLGWIRAAMGTWDAVVVDGRRIGDMSAGMILGSAARAAALAAGVKHLPLNHHDALVKDPAGWFTARY